MDEVKFTKIIYNLVYPDTKKVLSRLWKSNSLDLYKKAYKGSQDNLHEDFKQVWLDWVKDIVVWNKKLVNFYPTAGSNEAIRESISQYSHQKYLGHRLHIFEGDYEGYTIFAQAYGIQVIKHDRNDFNSLFGINSGERFYLSQPSSIDGNVWNKFDEFIKFLENFVPGTDLMIDLCYVGSTSNRYNIDLSSKLVHTVFFSLSKVFGVYYHRIGGIFSKKEMPGLIGNHWFENVFSLIFGIELMKKFPVNFLPKKYEKTRKKVIESLNNKYDFNLIPADVFILSNSNNQKLKDYQRINGIARICIAEMIDDIFNKKS